MSKENGCPNPECTDPDCRAGALTKMLGLEGDFDIKGVLEALKGRKKEKQFTDFRAMDDDDRARWKVYSDAVEEIKVELERMKGMSLRLETLRSKFWADTEVKYQEYKKALKVDEARSMLMIEDEETGNGHS